MMLEVPIDRWECRLEFPCTGGMFEPACRVRTMFVVVHWLHAALITLSRV
jgi:hypothetical protein